ncbi:MAG: geranylgeranylglycerol-phosphate geranylgeranyltransferase, partial [Caldithrix sp.]
MNFNLKGYFILVRPVNIFIGALTVFVGAVITGTIHPLEKVVLACISGSLIMAGGNGINDYFDLEIDRVNKPFRPLPSNIVTTKGVLSFAIILFALGVFLSIFIFPVAVFV